MPLEVDPSLWFTLSAGDDSVHSTRILKAQKQMNNRDRLRFFFLCTSLL